METYILCMIAIALVSALLYNRKTREFKIVLYDFIKLGAMVITSFIAITFVMETNLLHIVLVAKLYITYIFFVSIGLIINHSLQPQS